MKTTYYITALLLLFATGTPNLYAQKDKWTGKMEMNYYHKKKLPHGFGTMTYKNGDVFTGKMSAGSKVEGEFIYTNASGIKCKYVGSFKTSYHSVGNVFHGFGELWWDGNYYVGYFFNGKMWGYGTLVEKEGTTKSGQFDNDEFRKGFIADKNGKLIEKK